MSSDNALILQRKIKVCLQITFILRIGKAYRKGNKRLYVTRLRCLFSTFTEVIKITALFPGLEEILKKNKAQVKKEGTAKLVLESHQHRISKNSIPSQAVNVLEKLRRAGYQAYLVGGCIRDLLVGKNPKDFDVSTNATPEQIRKVFSNSRIIGRRFKIVHVVFGREIIEVTTFRSNQDPNSQGRQNGSTRVSKTSGMLVRDNAYGKNLVEDSQRRDFTINALYYDLNTSTVIDFHGGLYDLQEGVIDIIGDPKLRYSEDPVRIIRALRFCAKLGFKLAPRTSKPISSMSYLLKEVSNARMFEEVNKLFLTGHGLQSFRILRKFHIFEILFPGLRDYLDNQVFISFAEYALESSDRRFAENRRNVPHFLYAVLLWSRFQTEVFRLQQLNDCLINPAAIKDIGDAAYPAVMKEQETMTAIPLSILESIRLLWKMQLMMLYTDDPEYCRALAEKNLFRAAYDFLSLRAKFEPYLKDYATFWKPFYDKTPSRSELIFHKDRDDEHKARLKKDKFGDKRKAKNKERSGENLFQRDDGAERNERLARARAWRIAMNLEP